MSSKYPFIDIIKLFGPASRQLVMVGGWVPTVYFEYLWKFPERLLLTTDVDFGVAKGTFHQPLEQVLDEKLFSRKHLRLGKEYPYQLLFKKSIPIDFLADTKHHTEISKNEFGNKIILHPY